MKNVLYFLICLLLSIGTSMAQQRYEIQCNSKVNVREKPSTSSTPLGTLKNGEVVMGYGIDSGWAQVMYNNTTGYVRADYVKVLSLQEKTTDTSKPVITNYFMDKYSSLADTLKHVNLLWLMAPIILLSLVLYAIREGAKNEKGAAFLNSMKILSAVVFVLSLCELVMYSGDQLFDAFFDWPWYGMIMGFILFVAVTLNQIFGLFLYTGFYANGSMKVGILTILVSYVAGIVAAFVGCLEEWVLVLFFIGMFIQAGIIAYHTSRSIGLFWGIVHGLIFVIYAFATLLLFAKLLSILMLLFLLLGLLKAVGSGGVSSSSESITELPKEMLHPYTGMTLNNIGSDIYIDIDGNEYLHGMWNKPFRTKPKF